jgi:hypothetical protein
LAAKMADYAFGSNPPYALINPEVSQFEIAV